MAVQSASDYWNGKRVFITGSSGFLGSWMVHELRRRGATTVGLVRDLARGYSVMGDARWAPDFVVIGCLEDHETVLRGLNEYEADTVLHLGAQPIVGVANRSPRSTFEANIRGTWNVLEACRTVSTVKRVVVASSDKAYGTQPVLPYTEDMPLVGRHPYDVSKSCTDLIAQCYHQTYGLPVCITRAGNFFGGGDLNFNRIVPGTITSVLRGQAPVLRSDGSLVRDYIYVRDVVSAYLTLAEKMDTLPIAGEAFNFSSGNRLTVLELTHRILAAMESRLEPVVLNTAKAEIPEQYLNSEKAHRVLGWQPHYRLDEALREAVAWYSTYFATSAAAMASAGNDKATAA